MQTKTKRVLLVFLLLLVLCVSGMLGWLWYDNNIDRSGWVEKDGVRFYQDFHADPVSQWLDLPDGRYYFNDDGTPRTGWQTIDGVTYYFGNNGVMTTGWLKQDGKTHYFGINGAMVTGWLWHEEGRYYLRDGSLLTGWQTIDDQRYYFYENGIMAVGFTDIHDNRYYFDDDGVMATGITEVDGNIYNFQETGAMLTGWEELEGGKRYYYPEGVMAIAWNTIDGNLYYFDMEGIMYVGWLDLGEYRYYLQEDGTAAIGPTKIGGLTHYFSPKGIEVYLVNGLNAVPSYYERNLVTVTGWHSVDSRCYDALMKMLEDCNAAGIEYTFNSGYRTVSEQTAILEARTSEHMAKYGIDYDAARKKALETVAYPGHSEHHLGLAVDLLGAEAIAWFTEHCWDYGFIVRYTKEKEYITGIVDEPWHFRYVGTEVSLDMKDSGLCLEEYLGAQSLKWWRPPT